MRVECQLEVTSWNPKQLQDCHVVDTVLGDRLVSHSKHCDQLLSFKIHVSMRALWSR